MIHKNSANKFSRDTCISTKEYMKPSVCPNGNSSKQLLFKRFTDFIVSLTMLLALFPLLLVIAIIICLDSAGLAIYRQKRVGRHGNYFQIYKFRTMYEGTPDLPTNEMQILPTPVTKFGKLLRQTSLDELPQLFNILKGEMSLVGPRPALYNQEELTAKRLQAGVLEFPPGISGWAQVNGRDELSDSVKIELDKWYVDHWHYFLDWQIIFATFKAVLSRRGAI
jgi:O-antigen biosynthesis protein WbqP